MTLVDNAGAILMEANSSLAESELLQEVARLAREYARHPFTGETDDVVQDVVLMFLERIRETGSLDNTVPLDVAVAVTVHNRLCDLWRESQRRWHREERYSQEHEDSAHEWMSPDASVDESECVALYDRVMNDLHPRTRDAFLMVREQEATYAETAAALHMSVQQVRTAVALVYRRFRLALRTVCVTREKTISRRIIA